MRAIDNNLVDLTEVKLKRLKELKEAIKELEAESKMISDELKAGYFATNDEYKTSKGLVLATYKEQLRIGFNQTKFKQAEPALFEQYLDISAIRVFLIK